MFFKKDLNCIQNCLESCLLKQVVGRNLFLEQAARLGIVSEKVVFVSYSIPSGAFSADESIYDDF